MIRRDIVDFFKLMFGIPTEAPKSTTEYKIQPKRKSGTKVVEVSLDNIRDSDVIAHQAKVIQEKTRKVC